LRRLALDGFLIPRSDEHQGEYVPACDERLAWLTGFTGSAGAAIVLAGTAAIFIDGRYTGAGRGADRRRGVRAGAALRVVAVGLAGCQRPGQCADRL
jgi:hypothetical protein